MNELTFDCFYSKDYLNTLVNKQLITIKNKRIKLLQSFKEQLICAKERCDEIIKVSNDINASDDDIQNALIMAGSNMDTLKDILKYSEHVIENKKLYKMYIIVDQLDAMYNEIKEKYK